MAFSTKEIGFYREDNPFGFLSNFYNRLFTVDGISYDTNEHYFQAMKHKGTLMEDKVRSCATPGECKKVANSVKLSEQQVKHWEQTKDGVMLKGLRCKFTQHDDLAKQLRATGDAVLFEDTTTDKYWGRGSDKNGKNMLGVLLMQVRQESKDGKLDKSVYK